MNRFFERSTKKTCTALALSLALVGGLAAPSVILATPVAAQDAQPSAEHLRLAARYAELSGANLLYINVLNAQRRDIIRAIGSTNPDIIPLVTEVADAAYLEMADQTGPLFESVAAVYAERYSMEDLQIIGDFFESDTGQRFLEERRAADQAAFEASVAWGDSINVNFLARVRALLAERGVEL
ncbi:MAG: DUF2059 domain-containing protein [Devosiaceae bacterium]